MSNDILLTFNAGSSTLKLGVFSISGNVARRISKGLIDFRQSPPTLQLSAEDILLDTPISGDLHEILDQTINRLTSRSEVGRIIAVGHRVVHGGEQFEGPVLIDDSTLNEIEILEPMAPLHQSQSLRLIRAIRHVRPAFRQTASFDTAFHRTQSDLVRRFALPRSFHDEGIKRYGFHGLSYKFIATELTRRVPSLAKAKVVIAHLGSGASLCALDQGVSRDTSMGFSTLDGIPMGTRTGALDPGVVLHLFSRKQMSLSEIEGLLYHRSGLLGVSGISADSRELLASTHHHAREALQLFALRIAGEIGRLTATLGGLDAIVFTAGIGEHQSEIRRMVCERLSWLGVALDAQENASNHTMISTSGSRIGAFVIPTDEEQVIAEEALSILQPNLR
ncbi:MAG: acetate/propionate family kinase [Hyphomicrobiaceae bacterium]